MTHALRTMCLLAFCSAAASLVLPYGLDYYVAVGGELVTVFFGPAGDVPTISPLLYPSGILCQTLPCSLSRPPYRYIVEQTGYLRWQSNGSIAGVWDSVQRCFASLETTSLSVSLLECDFVRSEGLHISDLDLAFLQATLSKRSARFRCLDSVAYPTTLVPCGYDSRLQLNMASTAGSALQQAFVVSKATGDLQGYVQFLAAVALQMNLTVAAAQNASEQGLPLAPLEARIAFLEGSFEGLSGDAVAMLSGVWQVFHDEFSVIKSDLIALEAMWTEANIWDDLGRDSFADSRAASVTFQILLDQIQAMFAEPQANFSTLLHDALTDNMINYTVSLIDRLFYFGSLDRSTAPLLQLELETFAKMLTGHCFVVTLDALSAYRAYVQQAGNFNCTQVGWQPELYVETYSDLFSLSEFFYNFMAYFVNPGPYTDCLLRKMSEFSRVNVASNYNDAAKSKAFFPGMFTGLHSCRLQADLLASAYFRFDADLVTDDNSAGRVWQLKLIQNASHIAEVPAPGLFAPNNTALRLQSLPNTKRSDMPPSLPSRMQVHYVAPNATHLVHLRRTSRQWSEACDPGYYRGSSTGCDACPIGTFSPGDGLLHLCFNAPIDNTTYTSTLQTSGNCAFICLEEDRYRSGNSCALIPVGFASLDGGTLVPCSAPYGAAFAEFTSPGGRSVNGCANELAYQAVITAHAEGGAFAEDFLFNSSFTLELWLRWSLPPWKELTYGLLGVPGLWSWELQVNGNLSVSLRFRMEAASNYVSASYNATALIDWQWHHLAVVADANLSVLIFYVDGQERAYGYYSPVLLATRGLLLPTRLVIGGKQDANSAWLQGDIDEVRIHRARVPPTLLGYRSAALAADMSCESGQPVNNTCLPRCPEETARNSTELALDLAPLASPSDWSLAPLSAVCRCAPGEEWYLSQCISSCSGGAVRREWEECVCPEGQYQVWDLSGRPFFYVVISRNATISKEQLNVTGIEVLDSAYNAVASVACASNEMPVVCASDATPHAILATGSRLRLHLPQAGEISSITVRLNGTVTSTDSISLYATTSSFTDPIYIASNTAAQQGGNIFATRLFTASSSPLLKCISCPGDTAGARYPRASLSDCLCLAGTVRSGVNCIAALPAFDPPLVYPTDSINYPSALNVTVAFGGDVAVDAYFVVSIIASRYSTVVLSPQSPFLLLEESALVVVFVTAPNRLPSLATTMEYTVLPKAPMPLLQSPVSALSIHSPTGVSLTLNGAIATTPDVLFYVTVDDTEPSASSPWVTPGLLIVIARPLTMRARTSVLGYYLSDETVIHFPYLPPSDTCWLCIFIPIGLLIALALTAVVLRIWFWPQTLSRWEIIKSTLLAEFADLWSCVSDKNEPVELEDLTKEDEAFQAEMESLYGE